MGPEFESPKAHQRLYSPTAKAKRCKAICADVAELADALALGASVHDVGVRLPSSAPQRKVSTISTYLFLFYESLLKGVELERPENSSHLLFLAADRSILQSTKFELMFLLCKIQEQLPSSAPEKDSGFYLILSLFLTKSTLLSGLNRIHDDFIKITRLVRMVFVLASLFCF